VATGAAGGVEHRPRGELIEQRTNDRLLESDRVVARVVVAFGPLCIARIDPVLRKVAPLGVGMLLEGSGDLLDFAHALVGASEAPSGARAKQRQPLDAEHDSGPR
jgi:hypothetical protein